MYEPRQIPRVMLIGLSDTKKGKEELYADFEEVESLVNTYGAQVAAVLVQNQTRGDYETFIGQGKVEEAIEKISVDKIDIVVINVTIKPRQLHALLLAFQKANPKILVWDRVSLILEIFSKHAKTSEAKLQIKFAKLRQMGPRIYGMGMEMSQQAGGIGTRGIGETNTQLMLRHWRTEKGKIQKELTALSKRKTEQIEHRKKGGSFTISLVGYTNAGKTTLFNRITGQKDLVQNALFATLDSTVNKFYLQKLQKEVYLSDTIGFIKDLPPQLIDAFKSTLLETIHADLILHVIDSSDPRVDEKIHTVEEIFEELKIDKKHIMYVFNKADKKSSINQKSLEKKYGAFTPCFVSAQMGEGIDGLFDTISSRLQIA